MSNQDNTENNENELSGKLTLKLRLDDEEINALKEMLEEFSEAPMPPLEDFDEIVLQIYR